MQQTMTVPPVNAPGGDSSSHAADLDHVLRARSGDTQSFALLIERHQDTVFGVALAITSDPDMANDVSQDTFLAAWRGLAGLHDPTRTRAWLSGIARNLAKNAVRKMAREHEVRRETNDPDAVHAPVVDEREDARRLFARLRELPEKYRIPLILYYQEERSISEIAELLELSQSAVKKRLERGRDLIKDRVLGEMKSTLAGTRVRAGLGVAVVAMLGGPGSAATSTTTSTGHPASNPVAGSTTGIAKFVFAGVAACA
jgi:RNA polymerase sigma factor (sigma-70 family)